MRSETGPAEEVIEGEADGSELIADGGVEFGVSLFGDAGDNKEHCTANPGSGGVAGDGEDGGVKFGWDWGGVWLRGHDIQGCESCDLEELEICQFVSQWVAESEGVSIGVVAGKCDWIRVWTRGWVRRCRGCPGCCGVGFFSVDSGVWIGSL